MIYLTQLIYLKEGQEEIFHQFEELAIPIISRYNGRLLLRVRPDSNAFIDGQLSLPYEIHLVEFHSEDDFKRFAEDEHRKQFLHLKEKSIESVLLIRGCQI